MLQVELLILSHHFYKSSACLDGVDVLVALAATRVEAYVSEGDFPCLARLITGVGNFHALNFILGILIENGQLDLLLQKYSAAADTNAGTAEAVRGFRMAVLTSLKHFNSNDLDAFAMVCTSFENYSCNEHLVWSSLCKGHALIGLFGLVALDRTIPSRFSNKLILGRFFLFWNVPLVSLLLFYLVNHAVLKNK